MAFAGGHLTLVLRMGRPCISIVVETSTMLAKKEAVAAVGAAYMFLVLAATSAARTHQR